MASITATEVSDDAGWSPLEKEPFLHNHSCHRSCQRSLRYPIAIWLTSHIIIFAIFGSILTLIVRNTLSASTSQKTGVFRNNAIEFGGLPVHFDDPKGPYVTCETFESPAAAHQAGCRFDLFANGWTPGPCFDAEKHDYFISLHDYYFWKDDQKQHRIHQESLLAGDLGHLELYVSFEEHWEHCRYLLNATKRYAHDPMLGVLDIHMDEEHMNHCIDFLQESRDPYTLEDDVVAIFGYRKCFLPRLVSV